MWEDLWGDLRSALEAGDMPRVGQACSHLLTLDGPRFMREVAPYVNQRMLQHTSRCMNMTPPPNAVRDLQVFPEHLPEDS